MGTAGVVILAVSLVVWLILHFSTKLAIKWDEQRRICSRCAASVEDGTTVCPECGYAGTMLAPIEAQRILRTIACQGDGHE